jgi:hypothetical protein
MTSLGVWACQWRELRPITFGAKDSNSASGLQGDGVGEDEEAGHSRGRGRGRGRDGAGEYEMVGMGEQVHPV